jgi:hypothetical protein
MDEETRSWNEENIRAFFAPVIAEQILQIPISRHGGEDFVCWPMTRQGLYTVKLGYNMARTTKFL